MVNKIIHPGSLSQEELDKIKNDTAAAQAHDASVQAAQKTQEQKHVAPHSDNTVGGVYKKIKSRSQQIKDALGE